MILNRTIQPPVKTIDKISYPSPNVVKLDNGIPVYIMNTGKQDVIKIDVHFRAGKRYQESPLIAHATANLMTEGTKNMTEADISEKLDYFGASIDVSSYFDNATASLVTISKYLKDVLPIFDDIIKNPSFPDKELELFIEKGKQYFDIDQLKPKVIASRRYHEALFGHNHPYGQIMEKEHYDLLNRNLLVDFHNKKYVPNNCYITISGKITDGDQQLINDYFSDKTWLAAPLNGQMNHSFSTSKQQKLFFEQKDSLQSAIRIGKITIGKNDADIHKVKIVNSLLGGYFGSRLMQKIREEKGYTYGISSFISEMQDASYFCIATEVHKDSCDAAIEDIYGEMKRLRVEKMPASELASAQNYMLGSLLKMFDGPFKQAETLESLIDFNLKFDYYERLFDEIKNITPEIVIDIANKYFDENDMIEVVAGTKY